MERPYFLGMEINLVKSFASLLKDEEGEKLVEEDEQGVFKRVAIQMKPEIKE